jgi:NADH:ubiquinone oxidoreductase subunit E
VVLIYAIADVLGIPASDVEGVATFYSQIFRQPVGRHVGSRDGQPAGGKFGCRTSPRLRRRWPGCPAHRQWRAIEHEKHHYEDPRAASIEALKIVQKQRGWVPDGRTQLKSLGLWLLILVHN